MSIGYLFIRGVTYFYSVKCIWKQMQCRIWPNRPT